MAKVSICIPYYNSEKTLIRLLESIQGQNYTDYNVVITDDSPNDNVRKIVKKYSSVYYYKNKKQLGPTLNCNEAIKKSDGEYIKIMHHDDWFNDKDALSQFVNMLENDKQADFAFSGSHQVSIYEEYDRHMSRKYYDRIRKDWRNVYLGNEIGAPSATIFRRGYFFDGRLKWLVDVDLYMNILSNNNIFVYTEKPLVCIGMSDAQVTNSCINDMEMKKYEYTLMLEKYDLYQNTYCYNEYIKVMIGCGAKYREIKNCHIHYFDYLKYVLIDWIKKQKHKYLG